jgi:hypothetical protein
MNVPHTTRTAATADPARASAAPRAHPTPDTPDRRAALLVLGALAVLYTLAQFLLVVPGAQLGWDETVYVSQVSRDVPAAYFSAPRARGISYLVAPFAALTSSPAALHTCLALVSGAGLLGALWTWRRLLPLSVLALGGALFGTLWISLFYGPQAMPNQWSALGSLAAAGFFARAVRSPADRRGAAAGLGCAVAVVTLMRPPDGAWLVLALMGAAVLVRAWRQPALLAALAAGAVLGGAPWVVEAYAHYGGLLTRLHRASEIQGAMGWHVAIGDHLRSLQGKTLCRPCDIPWKYPGTALWWLALPPMTAAGLRAAFRAGRLPQAALATLAAFALALPYLFLMRYAAPRFLLPSYALLALPVAECLRHVVALAFAPRPLITRTFAFPSSGAAAPSPGVRSFLARRRAARALAATALAVAFAGHLAVQYVVLAHVMDGVRQRGHILTSTAARLHHLGVRPPCALSGWSAVPVAYYTGCASRQASGHDASVSGAELRKLREGQTYALLTHDADTPPRWARDWTESPLPIPHGRVHVAPRTAASGGDDRGGADPH